MEIVLYILYFLASITVIGFTTYLRTLSPISTLRVSACLFVVPVALLS